MHTAKRVLYVISGLFILLALLISLNVLTREFFLLNFGLVNMENIYRNLLLVSVFLLVLVMVAQGITSAYLKRELHRTNLKVNDLKADLYDKRQDALRKRPVPDSVSDPHVGFPASQPGHTVHNSEAGFPDRPLNPTHEPPRADQ